MVHVKATTRRKLGTGIERRKKTRSENSKGKERRDKCCDLVRKWRDSRGGRREVETEGAHRREKTGIPLCIFNQVFLIAQFHHILHSRLLILPYLVHIIATEMDETSQ